MYWHALFAVRLQAAYGGAYKNLVRFEGDHNYPRPQFFYTSVCCFFHQQLKLEDQLIGPSPYSTSNIGELSRAASVSSESGRTSRANGFVNQPWHVEGLAPVSEQEAVKSLQSEVKPEVSGNPDDAEVIKSPIAATTSTSSAQQQPQPKPGTAESTYPTHVDQHSSVKSALSPADTPEATPLKMGSMDTADVLHDAASTHNRGGRASSAVTAGAKQTNLHARHPDAWYLGSNIGSVGDLGVGSVPVLDEDAQLQAAIALSLAEAHAAQHDTAAAGPTATDATLHNVTDHASMVMAGAASAGGDMASLLTAGSGSSGSSTAVTPSQNVIAKGGRGFTNAMGSWFARGGWTQSSKRGSTPISFSSPQVQQVSQQHRHQHPAPQQQHEEKQRPQQALQQRRQPEPQQVYQPLSPLHAQPAVSAAFAAAARNDDEEADMIRRALELSLHTAETAGSIVSHGERQLTADKLATSKAPESTLLVGGSTNTPAVCKDDFFDNLTSIAAPAAALRAASADAMRGMKPAEMQLTAPADKAPTSQADGSADTGKGSSSAAGVAIIPVTSVE